MSWRIWSPVLPALEPHHAVLALTLPGHRGGPPVGRNQPVDVRSLTDAIEAQLDDTGLATPHVAGNSLGAWVALELARRGRSVVAFSPAGAWRTPLDLWRLHLDLRMGSRTLPLLRLYAYQPQLRRLLLIRLLERGDRIPAPEAVELLADLRSCTIIDRLFRAGWTQGQIRPLDRSACPIHIVWGARDRMLPFRRYATPLAARAPDVDIAILPGVGHVPMYDDPALVASTILDLTTQVDAEADPSACGQATGGST
jgi:pimeloyl-ACP methyl ester carboxylesterase